MSQFRFTRPNAFPPVVKNLIIINVLVYLAQITVGRQYDLTRYLALHDFRSAWFQFYQLVTYMFLHSPVGLTHILFNMLALWMFGANLENYWGSKRFLIYYLACGLGAGICHMIFLYFDMTPIWEQFNRLPVDMQLEVINSPEFIPNSPTLGASGAVFGILAAFGYLFPNTEILLYFAIPVKAKWFVLGYGAIELYMAIQNSPTDPVAHFAHLGGALTGIIIVLIWNKTNRRSLY